MKNRVKWLGLIYLMGCSGAQHGPARPAPFKLALQVVAGEPPAQRALALGDVVQVGEALRIEVQASGAIYVYVAQVPVGSAAEALYPASGDALLPARQVLRLPQGDGGLRLEGPAGPESIYVVATVRPLCEVDQALSQRLGLPCAAGGGPAVRTRGDDGKTPPPPPPPEKVTLPTRGDLLGPDAPPKVQRVDADARGVAELRLTYKLEQ